MQLVEYFDKAAAKGEPIDCYIYYQELAMHVIAHLALGQSDAEMFNNPINKHLLAFFQQDQRQWSNVIGMISPSLSSFVKMYALMKQKVAGIWQQQQKKKGVGSLEAIDRQIELAVKERQRQREEDEKRGLEPGQPIDFIDLFLDAKSEDNSWEEGIDNFQRGAVSVSKRLTFDEIVAQCKVFLLAGFDTTAISLSYATFLLTKHPEVQLKLQAEIDKECTSTVIGPETLPRMKYLDCVVKEALRMFPLASLFSSRTCMKDTVVGDNIHLKQGMIVAADLWSLHYSKEIYGEDAEEFKPERWLSSPPTLASASVWIPFGFGPRQCIGIYVVHYSASLIFQISCMRLALVEVKLTLCHLLRKFSFVQGPKTEEKLQLFGSMTVAPKAAHIYVKARE
ncbi:hypothetical protein WR25_24680 [Diploscapter pachys]|uniref:Cytochrome P450 n=1 Tax=Diploscapter pachys TaxID=2018661 RepID=A0A2A2KA90_9BILA|nr:hypothetical protein WR25_24680 [Diploscapter pachys]